STACQSPTRASIGQRPSAASSPPPPRWTPRARSRQRVTAHSIGDCCISPDVPRFESERTESKARGRIACDAAAFDLLPLPRNFAYLFRAWSAGAFRRLLRRARDRSRRAYVVFQLVAVFPLARAEPFSH